MRLRQDIAYNWGEESKKEDHLDEEVSESSDCFDDLFFSAAISSPCCFFRYRCAVAFTILTKKFISMNQTTVFQIKAREKSHFFPWGWNTKSDYNQQVDYRRTRQDWMIRTWLSAWTWGLAAKYLSFIEWSLGMRLDRIESKPGTKLSTQSSSFSTQWRSWLLQMEMMKIVCRWSTFVRKYAMWIKIWFLLVQEERIINLYVSLDYRFANHRCQKKLPEWNSELSTHYAREVKQRIRYL